RDPACLRTRGPELDTGANSGLANDKHRYGLRELNGSSEAAHGPEGAGHATVRVPRREPGARATSRRPGSTPSKIGDREPEAGTLYPPGFETAGGPDGCWTDPREGAPTVFGPWVQCAFNLSMFSVSCNSHYDTQFAAVFIDPRAE
ncbi:unnamed protein product, partial [Meganyctiphanes norvegica]